MGSIPQLTAQTAEPAIATYRTLEPASEEAFKERRDATRAIIEESALAKEESREMQSITEPAAKTQKVAAAVQTMAAMAAIVQSMGSIPQLTAQTAEPAIATYRTLEPASEEAFKERRDATRAIIEESALAKEESREMQSITEPAVKTQKVAAAVQTIAAMAAIVQSMGSIPQLTAQTAEPAIATYRTLEPASEEAFKERRGVTRAVIEEPALAKEESREMQSSTSLSTGVWQLSSGVLSTISEQQKPFFEIAEVLSQYSSVPTAASFPTVESPSGFPVFRVFPRVDLAWQNPPFTL